MTAVMPLVPLGSCKDESFRMKKDKEKFGGSKLDLLWSARLIHQLAGELKFKNNLKWMLIIECGIQRKSRVSP